MPSGLTEGDGPQAPYDLVRTYWRDRQAASARPSFIRPSAVRARFLSQPGPRRGAGRPDGASCFLSWVPRFAASLLKLLALAPVHRAIGYRGASDIERPRDSRVGEPFIEQRTHSSLECLAKPDRMLAQVFDRFCLQERCRRAPRRQMSPFRRTGLCGPAFWPWLCARRSILNLPPMLPTSDRASRVFRTGSDTHPRSFRALRLGVPLGAESVACRVGIQWSCRRNNARYRGAF